VRLSCGTRAHTDATHAGMGGRRVRARRVPAVTSGCGVPTCRAVYNLVFAALLFWADANSLPSLSAFMLASIVFVGAFGTTSALLIILPVQVMPAAIALVCSEIGRKGTDDLGFLAATMTASVAAALVGSWVGGEARKMRKARD
jgi:hypothetical protein